MNFSFILYFTHYTYLRYFFFFPLLANVLLYTCVHIFSINGVPSTCFFLFFATQVAVAVQLESKLLPSKNIDERSNEVK